MHTFCRKLAYKPLFKFSEGAAQETGDENDDETANEGIASRICFFVWITCWLCNALSENGLGGAIVARAASFMASI